jgi:hypothetical protein
MNTILLNAVNALKSEHGAEIFDATEHNQEAYV